MSGRFEERKLKLVPLVICWSISLGGIRGDGPLLAQPQRNSQTTPCGVEVDFSKAEGTIRHLNDVNGGPLCQQGYVDLSSYYKELGIKFVRLCDVPWTFCDAVNTYYVFPHFEADPDQPANYEFFETDWYLKSIEALGINIIYELGATAEPIKRPRRHIDPPNDVEKWARICVNLIKHYNSGWANGFHYNIQYWEIWNEPNLSNFWTGTPEQYYRLYEITAKAIKNYDPKLKVGGPVLAGSEGPFLEGFLAYCKNHKIPLDFVPWHQYGTQPSTLRSSAIKLRDLLNEYGFSKTESVLDEWSYYSGNWGEGQRRDINQGGDPKLIESVAQEVHGVPGAAYDATALMLLQDSPVDIANFYHGTTLMRWGLFDGYGVPNKTYYTFKAFKSLLDTPERVSTRGSDPSGLAAMAGLSHDKAQANLLISNYGTGCSQYQIQLSHLPWKEGAIYEKYALDKEHDLELVKRETLAGTSAMLLEGVEVPSVCLIRLKSSSGKRALDEPSGREDK